MYSLGVNTSLEVILALVALALVLAVCLSLTVILRRSLFTEQRNRDTHLNSTLRFPGNVRCVSQNVPGSWRMLQDGEAVWEIAPLPGSLVASGASIPVPSALNSWWETMLAKFPEVKRGIEKLGAKTFVLKFSPKVTLGLELGKYRLMSATGGGVRLNALNGLAACGKKLSNPDCSAGVSLPAQVR